MKETGERGKEGNTLKVTYSGSWDAASCGFVYFSRFLSAITSLILEAGRKQVWETAAGKMLPSRCARGDGSFVNVATVQRGVSCGREREKGGKEEWGAEADIVPIHSGERLRPIRQKTAAGGLRKQEQKVMG